MSWKRRPSHINRLTLRTTATVALALGLAFVATYLYSRKSAISEKETELRYAAQAFQQDAPEYPDLPEFKENHPEMSARVFGLNGKPEKQTGALELPYSAGFQTTTSSVLFGVDAANKHVVVGTSLRETARDLGWLAKVLSATWLLLVAIVWFVTRNSAHAVFVPLRRLAREANEIGGDDLSKRLQIDETAEIGEMTEHLNAMIDRLEKAADKERQFSSDVAHELRTPLAILRTQVETTLLRDRPVETYREALISMLSEIDRLSAISASLLATARSFNAEPPVTNIAPLVAQIVERWQERFQNSDQSLASQLGPATLRIFPSELEIVLDNLLENALNFSPSGAKTGVILSRTPEAITLVIRDEGFGIPPDLGPKIFDRLVRGESSRNRTTGGVGIGLSLVKKIVEGRGGKIHYESHSLGTSFHLHWPIT